MIEVVDALGRTLALENPARRIVSLVPSETHSVATLLSQAAVIGRTRFCTEPPLPQAVVVGGTKDVDVAAVRSLAPDLVLANKEENARKGVQALIDADLPVHVSFPQSGHDAADYLVSLARLVGAEGRQHRELRSVIEGLAASDKRPVRVFVPIWNDPWMTFDGRTFASDVLELCGGQNVFSNRPRRYPLAADLGRRPAMDEAKVGDRDTRYPRIRLEEVVARKPELVLLPDEPHEFGQHDVTVLVDAGIDRDRIRFVSGKDLFWYGAWMIDAFPRLAAILDDAR